MSDQLLLQQFVQTRSNAAFEAIVDRHLGMVYNSALRQVRNAALAEDVCQSVFMILAQKAGSLSSNVILSGWLLRTAHLCALDVLKTESRRKRREQRYAAMSAPHVNAIDPMVEDVSSQIDRALSHLKEDDRGAIVLRYFQGQSLNEVAAVLNVSEQAVAKRLQRALEKLRDYFVRHPVTPSLAALELAMRGLPHAALPASLASSVSSVAAAGTSAQSSVAAKVASKMLFWTKAKIAAMVGLALLGGAAAGTISIVRAQAAATPTTPPAPTVRPADSGFVGRLSNGVSVELISVREYPARETKWWHADGSSLTEAPFDKFDIGGSVKVDIPPKELIKREVAVHVNDKLGAGVEPATVVWMLNPSKASMDGRIVGPHLAGHEPTAASVFYLRRGDSVTLRANIAAGPWRTMVAPTPWGASGGFSEKGISFSYSLGPGMENNGRTHFIFAFASGKELPIEATQVMAVDKTGQEHLCTYGNSSHGDGTGALAFSTDVPLSKIKNLEFQSRPYDQWIEIRDICMDPTHPTNAKVATSDDPAEGL